ncbi:hypothetical protein [Nonomuraea dietziae]|uniref:hypothetical protein n=1 Tax=Nonomuraea dietziae TaxID=65515 RepID=UPI0031DAF0CA
MKSRLVVLLSVLALICLTGMTGAGASAEPPRNKQYKVQGPADARQRSAVAATGAAIDAVASDSVVVTATDGRDRRDQTARLPRRGAAVPVTPVRCEDF